MSFPVDEARALVQALGDDAERVERLQWGTRGTCTERWLFDGPRRGVAARVLVVGPRMFAALGQWANRSGSPSDGQPAVPAQQYGRRPMAFRELCRRVT